MGEQGSELCRRVLLHLVVALGVVGCGDDAPPAANEDSGAMTVDTGSAVCANDAECDDGRFCNGDERCAPEDDGADADGCAPGDPPCSVGQSCDDDEDACVDECAGDLDGDGSIAAECGGDDCDDTDPSRFPGNTEVCDPLGTDEDCNPETLGLDRDGDGYFDQSCCYRSDNGLRCGADCDDARATVSPEGVETCNGLDEDCDGLIDEGVQTTFYRDLDGDRYGTTETTLACSAPAGYTLLDGDCDDESPLAFPGATERCDGTGDEDCDGAVDNGCSCTSSASRECGEPDGADGFLSRGTCQVGTQACDSGVWDRCIGAVLARAELCDGTDDDCDGEIDNGSGFMCILGSSASCTTSCGTDGMQQCRGDCLGYEACRALEEGVDAAGTCNGCDDDLDGLSDEGFECVRGITTTCRTICDTAGFRTCADDCTNGVCLAASESCNYCDDDGDGSFGAAELSLASGSAIDEAVCDDFVLGGPDVSCANTGTPTLPPRNFMRIQMAQEGTADSVWSAMRASPYPIGYGPIEVRTEVTISTMGSPGLGWGLIIREAGAPPTGDTSDFGLPNDTRGIALVWRFSGPIDTIGFYQLGDEAGPQPVNVCTGSGPCLAPFLRAQVNDDSTDVTFSLSLTYEPDDPATAGNQARLVAGGSGAPAAGLEAPSASLNTDLLPRPGQPLEWGIITATDSNSHSLSARVRTQELSSGVSTTFQTRTEIEGLCPSGQ